MRRAHFGWLLAGVVGGCVGLPSLPTCGDESPCDPGTACQAGACVASDGAGVPPIDAAIKDAAVDVAAVPDAASPTDAAVVPVDAAPPVRDVAAPTPDATPLDARPTPDAALDPAILVWIALPAGRFNMGSQTLGNEDERPVHRVDVPAFELSLTEVTVAQYRACVEGHTCTVPQTGASCNWGHEDRDDFPVNCVSWYQAQTFAAWTGDGARLPTEAEWEYAARNGGTDVEYPWGFDPPTCDRVVMDDGGAGCRTGHTLPVCSKPDGNSEAHVCDLIGNVWEWVEDTYAESYGWAPNDGSASVDPGGAFRVSRGGSYRMSDPDLLRARTRGFAAPDEQPEYLGIRLARTPR